MPEDKHLLHSGLKERYNCISMNIICIAVKRDVMVMNK